MNSCISQREARRLKKRVEQLEELERRRRHRWVNDYPGGVHLGAIPRERDWLSGRIEAARMLGHAVVVTDDGRGELNFYALELGKPA